MVDPFNKCFRSPGLEGLKCLWSAYVGKDKNKLCTSKSYLKILMSEPETEICFAVR